MHELAITEGIMEAALPAAKEAGAKKILEIRLKIGELSGVIPECIQEYFDIISKDTIAQDAKLIFEKIPITIRCKSCDFEGEIEKKSRTCPKCNSNDFSIIAGREYFVDNLKVE